MSLVDYNVVLRLAVIGALLVYCVIKFSFFIFDRVDRRPDFFIILFYKVVALLTSLTVFDV